MSSCSYLFSGMCTYDESFAQSKSYAELLASTNGCTKIHQKNTNQDGDNFKSSIKNSIKFQFQFQFHSQISIRNPTSC